MAELKRFKIRMDEPNRYNQVQIEPMEMPKTSIELVFTKPTHVSYSKPKMSESIKIVNE